MATKLYQVGTTSAGVPKVLTINGTNVANACCCEEEEGFCQWYREWTFFCVMSCDSDMDSPTIGQEKEASIYYPGEWYNDGTDADVATPLISIVEADPTKALRPAGNLQKQTPGTVKKELPAWSAGTAYEVCDHLQHGESGYRCVLENRQVNFVPIATGDKDTDGVYDDNGVKILVAAGTVIWTKENRWVDTGTGTVCIADGDSPYEEGVYYLVSIAPHGRDVPSASISADTPCGWTYRVYGRTHAGCDNCPDEADASTEEPSFTPNCPSCEACFPGSPAVRDAGPAEPYYTPCKFLADVSFTEAQIISFAAASSDDVEPSAIPFIRNGITLPLLSCDNPNAVMSPGFETSEAVRGPVWGRFYPSAGKTSAWEITEISLSVRFPDFDVFANVVIGRAEGTLRIRHKGFQFIPFSACLFAGGTASWPPIPGPSVFVYE